MNVTLTPQAAAAVRQYVAARGLGPHAGLRIVVHGPDRYTLAVGEPGPLDARVVAQGVSVFAHREQVRAVGTVVIDGGTRRGEPRLRLIAVAPGLDPGYSSRPARLPLDLPALARVQPELFRPDTAEPYPELLGEIAETARQLYLGDCNAAVVLSVRPFRVAAYADELDCVAVLDFVPVLAVAYLLSEGSRMLAVNFYRQNLAHTPTPSDDPLQTPFGLDTPALHQTFGGQRTEVGGLTVYGPPAADLIPGRKATGRWQNFGPLIADLLTADRAALADRKAGVPGDNWVRCEKLAAAHARARPGVYRDGSPRFCWDPAPAAP